MINLFQEYASWVKEIEDFYLETKEHEMSLYDRFMPIYEVLNHIYLGVSEKTLELTDDLEKIFSVGFEYLHDQIESCRMYLEMYFQNDFHEFMEYDGVMATLFFLEDIRYELTEKDIEVDPEKINQLTDEIETMLHDHQPIPEGFVLYVDDVIKNLLEGQDFEFYGIIDIFCDVAEALGVYLYEEEDLTLGKDI